MPGLGSQSALPQMPQVQVPGLGSQGALPQVPQVQMPGLGAQGALPQPQVPQVQAQGLGMPGALMQPQVSQVQSSGSGMQRALLQPQVPQVQAQGLGMQGASAQGSALSGVFPQASTQGGVCTETSSRFQDQPALLLGHGSSGHASGAQPRVSTPSVPASHGSADPLSNMLAGMAQLQDVVLGLAKKGDDQPENIKYSWNELPKLPSLGGSEAALGFTDWLYLTTLLVKDMSDTSSTFWDTAVKRPQNGTQHT